MLLNLISIMNCFVFDMDGVLIETDPIKDKEDLYLKPTISKYFDVMHEYFKSKRKNCYDDVLILTSRHPDLTPWIKDKFNLRDDQIYTRDFCLKINEMSETINDKEKTAIFYDNMVKYKTKILNELSKKYVKIYFFEDFAGEFKENIPSNVSVMIPWHMQKSNKIER